MNAVMSMLVRFKREVSNVTPVSLFSGQHNLIHCSNRGKLARVSDGIHSVLYRIIYVAFGLVLCLGHCHTYHLKSFARLTNTFLADQYITFLCNVNIILLNNSIIYISPSFSFRSALLGLILCFGSHSHI